MAREKTVENKLKSRIEEIGGACEKHITTFRGDPDRLCSFPNGYVCLAETKWLEDVKPEDHQLRRHGFWRKRGMDVWVIGCAEHIEQLIDFAGIQTARLSVGGGTVPGGASARHVGGGPWVGKNRDEPFGPGHAEISRLELFPGARACAKESSRRRLVWRER